ncbi:MAG: hypothetical protein ACJ8F7_06660 [Gemmataceae bacterium]
MTGPICRGLPAALFLVFAPAAPAQPTPDVFRATGTEAFRAVLNSYGLKPIDMIARLDDYPANETLVISFRSSDYAERHPADWLDRMPFGENGLRSFINAGGAVLVASDAAKDNGWADNFQVEIAGNKVYSREPRLQFFETDCPYIVPVSRANPDPDLFAGSNALHRVATNRPSFLASAPELAKLAEFPETCAYKNRRGTATGGPFLFGASHQHVSGGRLLVLADQDIFVNSMLLPPPPHSNDNLDFTINCLDWLTNGRQRKYVLFVDDNKPETDFNLILKSLPPTTPEQLLDYLREHPEEALKYLRQHPELITNNLDKASPFAAALEDSRLFAEIEERNLHNDLLLRMFEHWELVRNVIVLGALALLGYGLLRFLKSRQRSPAGVPRFAVALERYRPRVGLLERRLREALRTGQHYEAAREMARAMFADLALTPAAEGPPPAFEVNAGYWQRGRFEAELRDIWRIAFGPDPEPVTTKQWLKWPARVLALRKQFQAGTIRFVG